MKSGTNTDRNIPALLALSLGYFSLGTISLGVVGLNAPIGTDLGVPPAQVGLQVTVFALTFAVAAPFMPAALRRFDHKVGLLLGLAVLTTGAALGALAPSYGLLSGTRVIAALGAAVVGPGASAIGAQIVPPERRQRALALVFSGMTAAAVLGVPLASFLGGTMGWRPAMLGIAAISVISLGLVALLVPRVPAGEPPTLRSFRDALRTPASVATVSTTLLFMAAQFVVYGVAGAFLTERFGASAGLVSGALLGFGVVGVLGTALSAPIAERIGGARTVTIAVGGLGAAFVAIVLVPSTVLGLGIFVAWAFFSQLFMAPQQARLVGLLPTQAALILALNASGLYLGMSLGSTLGSTLLPPLGPRLLPLAGLVLVLLAGITHYLSVRRMSAAAEPAPAASSQPSPTHA